MPEQGLVSVVKELATLVGKGWFAVVIGALLGVYGAIKLIVRAEASGWVWIAIALAATAIIALNIAYQALKERNVALAGDASGESKSVVIHGGEHNHYYGGPPQGGGSTS